MDLASPGVVDGLGQPELEHLGLQPPLQEVLDLEAQHVVELHAGLVQHTDTDQATQQGVTFEKTFGVLLLQSEQFPGGRTDLGEAVLDPPYLPLVPEPVLSNELELLVKASLLERSPGCGVVLAVLSRDSMVHHLDLRQVSSLKVL